MAAGRRFLALCERLHKAGLLKPRFEVGERIGRGFADLGAEEFQIIGTNRIASLFTADVSELLENDRHFFFVIPDVDQLADLVCATGFDIKSITRPDQRQWELRLTRAADTRHFTFSADTLLEVYAQAYLELLAAAK